MNRFNKRLSDETAVVVVIDIQDKLLAKIPVAHDLLRNTAFVLDTAALLGIPIIATEQYPKGLGPTVRELIQRLQDSPMEKTTFSCCGAGMFLTRLTTLQRPDVILVGMETHVCVSHTAFDLLEAGFQVFLPMDALASRFEVDHVTALRRLEHAGAILSTVEAIAFECLRDASHPQFKAVSKLIVARRQ
jgi:nicotinamidase-related amidase